MPSGRHGLLAATPSHLRIWVAPSTSATSSSAASSPWQALFLQGHAGSVRGGSAAAGGGGGGGPPPPLAVLEAVAPSPYSQLQLYWPIDISELPSRFAWLVGGVVYHGDLDWEAAAAAAEAAEAAAANGAGPAAAAAAAAVAGGADALSGVVSLPLEGAGAGGACRPWVCVSGPGKHVCVYRPQQQPPSRFSHALHQPECCGYVTPPATSSFSSFLLSALLSFLLLQTLLN